MVSAATVPYPQVLEGNNDQHQHQQSMLLCGSLEHLWSGFVIMSIPVSVKWLSQCDLSFSDEADYHFRYTAVKTTSINYL